MKLVECVPNFSEGRDMSVIEAIGKEIDSTDGAKLLDMDPGADTNRTVVTFIGTPEGVVEAAFKATKKAAELIDMSKHSGAHARMGATDVCPFVPVAGVTMEDCAQLAHQLGKRVGDELGIPVYLYEEAATRPERRNLATVRSGEYEGLEDKLKDPEWQPDYGPARFNPTAGATVIGAREFLIAYNVNLSTKDRKLAHEIALNIREKGRAKRDKDGKIVRDEQGTAIVVPGTFKAIKAVGWIIEEYGLAQVSINFTNYKISPPHLVFDEICRQAEALGIRVTGSELVGLIPKEAMLMAGRYYLEKQGKSPGLPEEDLIRQAVLSLGLDQLGPFEPEKKIIEYQFGQDPASLIRQTVRAFANELSTDSPAPGGGSTASLAGSLGAALAAMVANLTVGKKGYGEVQDEMKDIALRAQELKDAFLIDIDRDAEAFNQVMACFGMKKKTNEQKAAREAAIQEATVKATEIPFQVLGRSLDVMDLALAVAQRGNRNSVSDAGVAGLMALACAEGALLNVLINLPSITDTEFCQRMRSESEKLIKQARQKADEVRAAVYRALEKRGTS
jgi:glutamate formiminotransferase/formiminotetrahydrofolate cyclodeaminase